MTYYKLRETQHSREGTNYTTYGIDAFDSKTDTLLESFPDLSFEKSEVTALITVCNKLQLDIVHLHDVVEDFIS